VQIIVKKIKPYPVRSKVTMNVSILHISLVVASLPSKRYLKIGRPHPD